VSCLDDFFSILGCIGYWVPADDVVEICDKFIWDCGGNSAYSLTFEIESRGIGFNILFHIDAHCL
jgi:hypothetical protein